MQAREAVLAGATLPRSCGAMRAAVQLVALQSSKPLGARDSNCVNRRRLPTGAITERREMMRVVIVASQNKLPAIFCPDDN